MNIKKHKFFKKYRILKYILLLHLAFSLLIFTSELIHGIIDGNALGSVTMPFENYTALYNPEKYLKNDFFVVDTAFIEETPKSKSSSSIRTKIKGNLLHSNIKRELICNYDDLNAFYKGSLTLKNDDFIYVYHKKANVINVWRNTINDSLFLKEKKAISNEKLDAIFLIYIQISIIMILTALIILKKKSEIPTQRVRKAT